VPVATAGGGNNGVHWNSIRSEEDGVPVDGGRLSERVLDTAIGEGLEGAMASARQVDCRERPGMATNITIPRWSWVRRLPETGELLARPHRTRGRRSPDPHENAENPPGRK